MSIGDDSYDNSTPEKGGLSDGKNVEGQNLPQHPVGTDMRTERS